MKILIIGGVAGGATVASRLRRMDEYAEIILCERGEYISYANCGLPYYIGNTITERDRLFVQTVEGFSGRFNVDVRTQSEVISIHPENKMITVKNGLSGDIYKENYDKLIVSTGAEPIRPPIPGIDSEKIFTLRTIPDTDRIKSYIEKNKPKRAVIVGGGFIGLEMAENLHTIGLSASIIEMSNQVMASLDFSMAAMVHQHLKSKKVDLFLEEKVCGFDEKANEIHVRLESGKTIATDLVIWSVGVRPESSLAKNAGLSIGSLGGISVNEYMQTSNQDIYALGDAVEVLNPITGKPALIPLAGPANKQARIVANNIIEGNAHVYAGTIGTSIAKVFDLTVASAGTTAKALKNNKIDYISSYTHGISHAGYYPEALPLSIKIIFAPKSGQLYGAQVVGFDGVDKRIEMLAQVIQRKGTIYDLMSLEQAYAPPFSSAKDPVNIAGFVAENILKEKVKIIHWREILNRNAEQDILLDVRTKQEYDLGHITHAINIPVDELRNRIHELPKNKPIVIYCAIGLRGYLAYRVLSQHGFSEIYNLSGGYKTYSATNYE